MNNYHLTTKITTKIVVITTLTLCFLSSVTYKALSQDDLWKKAVNISEKSKNYKAKELNTKMYELDKNGSVKSETTIYQKLKTVSPTKYDTYKVIKDGEDITAESIKKMKSQKPRGNFFDDTNLFSNEAQKKITSNKIGNERINDKSCSVYDIVYKKDEKMSFKGKAWLNDSDGKPVKVAFVMDPLPMGVKKMSILYSYGTEEGNAYLEKIEVDGKAGILFYEKNFKMKMEFKKFK